MTHLLALAIVLCICAYVGWVHALFLREKRICATYPYYRLRDEVIWEILSDPARASGKESLYTTLNKIVHHTDRFGWRFLSVAVKEVTVAVLENGKRTRTAERPEPLELALVSLVVASAKKNSLAVRLALTKFGRVLLLYPVTKACYEHFWKQRPDNLNMVTRRIETVRRVRRLDSWRQAAGGLAA
jgi:hypothetical protein